MFKNVFNFFFEVRSELAKVNWPTRGQTIRMTAVVVVVTVVMGAFIGALDFLFTKLFGILIQG
ncbi:MAG: preprotein translocase subunit SecE [bacterium]|nr:preprotein translocase subunit SecE [bacterium]